MVARFAAFAGLVCVTFVIGSVWVGRESVPVRDVGIQTESEFRIVPEAELRFRILYTVEMSIWPPTVRRKGERPNQTRSKESEMTTAQEYLERRWTALILLCVAQFVVVLDASIVNVALPSIGKGLSFSEQNLPWVVNAYVIAFGGFLLLGGRAADLLGRRRVFMAGGPIWAGGSPPPGLSSAARRALLGARRRGAGAGGIYALARPLTR